MGNSSNPVNPWNDYLKDDFLPYSTMSTEHSDPLTPLRGRDLGEMSAWFAREDMSDLEQDINGRLSHLFPEPCWEEAWVFRLSWA